VSDNAVWVLEWRRYHKNGKRVAGVQWQSGPPVLAFTTRKEAREQAAKRLAFDSGEKHRIVKYVARCVKREIESCMHNARLDRQEKGNV
jgi:hypothetical protein